MSLANAKPVTFIMTRDRIAAEEFYSDKLHLPMVEDDGFAAVYALAGAVLRITEVADFVPSAHPVLGWEVPDIEAAMRDLADNGVWPTIYEGFGQDELGIWTAPDGKSKVGWFSDPDGNALSLTQA